jgi:hypothetical protein
MKAVIKAWFPEALNANIDISDKKIEICIDNAIPENLTKVPDDTIRFFVTTQPEGDYNKIILENRNCFTYLLTQFPELLQLPNAGKLVGCGSFIDPNPSIEKKFGVSFIITNRNCLPGHQLKFELYNRRKEIKILFDIYGSSWNPVQLPGLLPMAPWDNRKDKTRVMDCMYHICIDSYKRKDHYSEKLIDPLITKTIPIYWGCTNVGEYFNEQGIIQVDTIDDIIKACNQLTPEVYERMLPIVNDNYESAVKVCRYEDILRDAMIKILQRT